jgi:endogenous inhibitor of DNA gyrase (YacG/DUF329 family)
MIVVCNNCGIEFDRWPSHVGKHNFCSRSCKDKNQKTSVVVECVVCGAEVEKKLSDVIRRKNNFCSTACQYKNQKTSIIVNCVECGTKVHKWPSVTNKYKNNFCSISCSSKYNNRHKTHGSSRSKLELWLEKKLTRLYPKLEIHYCRRDTIGMELDIYIPSIKIAFELNGPTHYKPIYGKATFKAVKYRDKKRKELSKEHNIKLIEIDVSDFTFYEHKVDELNYYLNLVKKEINEKLQVTPSRIMV